MSMFRFAEPWKGPARLDPIPLLASRKRVLERIVREVEEATGWILLTGDAGSGKTLLCDGLARSLPEGWQVARIELAPESDRTEILRRVLLEIDRREIDGKDDLGITLRDALADLSREGTRALLVVDEVQNASDAALECLRLLSNGLAEPWGLGGLVLCGQTALVNRLGRRRNDALRNRMRAHHHLMPLDPAEAAELVRTFTGGAGWPGPDLAAAHRSARGNARALAMLARDAQRAETPAIEAVDPSRPEPSISEEAALPGRSNRPPLRVEEGLIEVGWSEPAARPIFEPGAAAVAATTATRRTGLEAIDDRYAAIQAGLELGRATSLTATADRRDPDEPAATRGTTWVRAESPHETSPSSHLFSRVDSDPCTDEETA